MSTSITISETIPVSGTCPMDNQYTEIDVTYRKYNPLGSECAYAIVTGIDCDKAGEECAAEKCPIAHSRVYW
ncbi:MAG: hypothetical protein LUH07_07425 [Lachnospiraceae bacterium]|nr:hypothetical protein [Lachnospiraceae bacterium]